MTSGGETRLEDALLVWFIDLEDVLYLCMGHCEKRDRFLG